MSTKLKTHAYADMFPLMEGEPFDDLCKSLEENGQVNDIVLLDGKILDGRNRYNGCLKVGLTPVTRDYEGSDPLSYVWAQNGQRRHLTASQLGTIGAEIALMLRKEAEKTGEPVGDTAAVAAEQVGASPRQVERALKLKKSSPKKFEQVKAGQTTLSAVETTVKQKLEKKRQQKTAQDKDAALLRIGKVCGIGFRQAVDAGTILKTDKEVIKMADLEEEDMLRIQLLVQQGWGVGKALKYKMTGLSRAHKIKDLLDRAAAQGGKFNFSIEGWEITVKRQ